MKKSLGAFIAVLLSIIFFNTSVKATSLEYVYDSKNQLTEIKENEEEVVRFEYDLNGNLLSQRVLPLTEPQNLKFLFVNDKTAELAWDKVTGAASYEISVNDGPAIISNKNSIILTLSSSINTYAVKIKAKNSFTQSEFGDVLSFNPAPPPPTELSVSNIQETSINLSWNPSRGATEYQVYYAHPNGTVPMFAGKTSESNLTIINLKYGTGYKFFVVAINGNLQSSFSEPLITYTAMNALFKDTYEPNDSNDQAVSLTKDVNYESYISSKNDIDYFKATNLSGYNLLYVQIDAINRTYKLEIYNDNNILGTIKSNENGMTIPIGNTSNISFKVIGDFSYSTKDSYKVKFTLASQETNPVCPPRTICQDPYIPPVEIASLPMKTMDLYESANTYDMNITTDIYSPNLNTRLAAFQFISQIGVPEDIDALEFIKKNSTSTEEKDIINWVIAKIAYHHYKEQPNTVLRYLNPSVLRKNTEMQAWLMQILYELFPNNKAVQAYLNSFLSSYTEEKYRNF